MATKNDITGDSIQTKIVSDSYRNNYDQIFRVKTWPDNPLEGGELDEAFRDKQEQATKE